ncbi:Histidine kinase [Alteripontixanthobacter maritimus]|uniref:histidine kinase n=1 Tax=Alteripontixanthobacter maritimus TaxID=2161824 RepID=A0A369Q6W3_9SPHN|nr:ATP-binding protein [Alteripontixanthobacter maritimus]RDC59037.1 Histidine kinase [Alteripontixanthobacter maritimus]
MTQHHSGRFHLWPQSLRGQVLLGAALALLLAQAISAVLLLGAADNRREEIVLTNLAFRLAAEPRTYSRADNGQFTRRGPDRGGGRGGRFRTRTTDELPPRLAALMDRERSETLRQMLAAQGIDAHRVAMAIVPLADDPRAMRRAQQRLEQNGGRFAGARPRDRIANAQVAIGALQLADGGPWRVTRVFVAPRQAGVTRTIIIQTAVLFAVLLALLALLLGRITRPLARLTSHVQKVGKPGAPPEPLAAEGPRDIADLIAAQTAMEARIAAMLDEKDVMLGAIGHDLKTPLAALRVRIESVTDEAQRSRMADGIDDIARSLDDILTLSRVGKASTLPEMADLRALAAGVVEEFEDMGSTVELAEGSRVTAPVHISWMRRALRNLVSNALRYGGDEPPLVTVTQSDGHTILRVEDNGPGIPEDRIEDMLQPFTRGEASRNRATGGAGLGLTLARAIAQEHGGELLLTNRKGSGLRAEIRLPTQPSKRDAPLF